MRVISLIFLGLIIAGLTTGPVAAESPLRPKARPAQSGDFATWLKGFRTRAIAAGIPEKTLNRALKGIRPNRDVIKRDRSQNEFTKTVWVYLDTAVSAARVSAGQKAVRKHGALLRRIEKRYGVEKEIVAAIWGLESAYGSYRGNINTIEALATLAHDTRRAGFFEGQLIDALKILAAGDARVAQMKGSWAGAMGHTQFMPSSFLAHAQDFDRNGRRNIWDDDPTDALASAAAYLKANGWKTGMPWGVEVRLPKGFNYMMARRDMVRMPSEWANLGVRDMSGRAVPDHGPASVLLPGGATGAAFLIFDNFAVLETYNTADAYVIGVGHLADRIGDGPAIAGDWPRQFRALSFDERVELQKRLRAAGFDPQKLDGKVGPLTINAVRGYQKARGLVPDGYPSPGFLKFLRRNP